MPHALAQHRPHDRPEVVPVAAAAAVERNQQTRTVQETRERGAWPEQDIGVLVVVVGRKNVVGVEVGTAELGDERGDGPRAEDAGDGRRTATAVGGGVVADGVGYVCERLVFEELDRRSQRPASQRVGRKSQSQSQSQSVSGASRESQVGIVQVSVCGG